MVAVVIFRSAVLFVTLGLLANAAHADTPDQVKSATQSAQLSRVAEQHFKTGLDFYRSGELTGARVEFGAAYDLSRLPDLLHNLSMVAQLEGKLDEAVSLEERYISESGPGLPERDADQARGRIVRLRQLQAREAPAQTAKPEVPQNGPVLPARDAVLPVRPQPTYPWTARRKAGVGLLAGGGAMLLTSAALGIYSATAKTRLESGTLTFDEAQDLAGSARSAQTGSIVVGLVGGGLVVAGVSLLAIRPR